MDDLLILLKALSEPTRLRLLYLCDRSDLSVSDLTNILRQSQPRVSRHLKIMVEAGALSRLAEGQRVYFARLRDTPFTALMDAMLASLPHSDPLLAGDLQRLEGTLSARAQLATGYFNKHAAQWDQVRRKYNDTADIEQRFIAELAADDDAEVQEFLDIGTGTGRILSLAAPHVRAGLGIDNNAEMLTIARAQLQEAGLRHVGVQNADMYSLPFETARFDAVALYQVLHFSEDPLRALREAARVLNKGGRLLICDYAEHDYEELSHTFAHLWLGFSDEKMLDWLAMVGLEPLVNRRLSPAETQGPTAKLWVAQKG